MCPLLLAAPVDEENCHALLPAVGLWSLSARLSQCRLWHGVAAVVLPPKAFDVLHYLVTHPDRLVTKDELLDALWPETAV